MKQKITAIYTDDTTPRRYVSATSRRTGVIDNNLAAELTEDKNKAHDFGSISNANLIIPRIHNPFERVYKHCSLVVEKTNEPVSEEIKGMR